MQIQDLDKLVRNQSKLIESLQINVAKKNEIIENFNNDEKLNIAKIDSMQLRLEKYENDAKRIKLVEDVCGIKLVEVVCGGFMTGLENLTFFILEVLIKNDFFCDRII